MAYDVKVEYSDIPGNNFGLVTIELPNEIISDLSDDTLNEIISSKNLDVNWYGPWQYDYNPYINYSCYYREFITK